MQFEELWRDLANLDEVEALALGGSRASDSHDERSDYDLYVYCNPMPQVSARRQLLTRHCQYMEIDNRFWEPEDDCTMRDGIDIDIVYRNLDAFAEGIRAVVDLHHPSNGYTTCNWHNLIRCRVLYDQDGRLRQLQKRYTVPYPHELRQNIIDRNLRLLTGNLPSYDRQIQKAIKRDDQVSVGHRTAAFMESYFDIVFAMNGLTHPGEKRMLATALKEAKVLPRDFKRNIQQLYSDPHTKPEAAMDDIRLLVDELKSCLSRA